jgi:hypothetical protein
MRIDGISLALLDIHREHRRFNRWYDLDHLPEHVSKADVIRGQRYVATGPTRRAEGVLAGPLTNGHPPYATIYSFGGPLDFRGDEALAGWRDKDHGIVRAGRYWLPGSVCHSSSWRPADARSRASMPLSAEAVPYLAHRSVILAIGRVADAERAVAWWDATQRDAILDLEGVLAVQRLTPADPAGEGLMLHLVLCESDPVTAIGRLAELRAVQGLTGRFPAHRGEYEPLALLPYERIVPFQYDFVDELDLPDRDAGSSGSNGGPE